MLCSQKQTMARKQKFHSSKNFALQREKVQGANSLIQWSSSFPVILLKVEPPGSSQLVNFSTEPAQWLCHCTAHDHNTFITAVIISNSRLYNRGWGKYTVLQDSHMIHQITERNKVIHSLHHKCFQIQVCFYATQIKLCAKQFCCSLFMHGQPYIQAVQIQ